MYELLGFNTSLQHRPALKLNFGFLTTGIPSPFLPEFSLSQVNILQNSNQSNTEFLNTTDFPSYHLCHKAHKFFGPFMPFNFCLSVNFY
jgi:hypothetical protein